ncbi:MAG: hypothetical protein M1543_03250 [Firmicutes bacterium]|nr:hypothetical protein [Bacillota bacterium]
MTKKEWLMFATLVVVAFVINLSYPHFFKVPPVANDAVQYDTLGWNLAQGKGYLDENGQPSIWRTPGYPVFLAGLYWLFGHNYSLPRACWGL